MALAAGSDPPPTRISSVLGQKSEGLWSDRLSSCRVDVLRLSQAEAHRSRLRKRTNGGAEVALSLDRNTVLRDGAVLAWDEDGRTALVARVDLGEVMVIDFGSLLSESAEILLARSLQVGHALGNQHWPAVVSGRRVYVPVTLARDVMAAVVQTHGFDGISCSFAPGDEVARDLSPDDARMLFASAAPHRHDSFPGAVSEEPQ